MKNNKHFVTTTMATLDNTRIKRKCTSIVMPIIEATNKHNKIIMEAMD
jgi:hypothetical protein